MRNVIPILSFHFFVSEIWRSNWAWGLPLTIFTVLIHVFGLGLVNKKVTWVFGHFTDCRYPMLVFAVVLGTTTLLATFLHAIEAGIWALSYVLIGALPDFHTAMLYSLNAVTSYGHESVFLESRWQLLGAMEALNGWLLFGLSTAFLFGIIHRIGLLEEGSKSK